MWKNVKRKDLSAVASDEWRASISAAPLPSWFLQEIEATGVRRWGSAKRLKGKGLADRECREFPLPALVLKRYDSKRVRGWGSVNDMIPWGLGGKHKNTEGVGRTAWRGRMARRAPRDSADLTRPL